MTTSIRRKACGKYRDACLSPSFPSIAFGERETGEGGNFPRGKPTLSRLMLGLLLLPRQDNDINMLDKTGRNQEPVTLNVIFLENTPERRGNETLWRNLSGYLEC